MKTVVVLIVIVLFWIAIAVGYLSNKEKSSQELSYLSNKEKSSQEFLKKAFTYAVYNGTHLQDYFVECVNGVEVNRTAVTKAIYVGRNWTDWRESIPSCSP